MGVFVKLLSLGCSILASLKEAGYELASKYPPAEPGALRLLAPQRGLIVIGQDQNKTVIAQSVIGLFVAVIPAKAGIQWLLDSGSRFTCPE